MSLSITTRRLADGTVEIAPRGEIDMSNAKELVDAVALVISTSRPTRITINLWQVTLFDSMGIGALVDSYKAATASGALLFATNPTRTVERQLRISGLAGLMRLGD